jgi:lipopolysaccharide/colanic/teichoic acid biosynthesis glycosyltransferase
MSETEQLLIEKYGQYFYEFVRVHLDKVFDDTLFIDTSSALNFKLLTSQSNLSTAAVVNLKRLNDMRYINKLIEQINECMPEGGLFIGCFETKERRKQRILNKYPPILRWFFYGSDFFVKRVIPKLWGLKKLYFALTRGQNRVLSRMEGYGRLYSCGFELITTENFGSLHFFVCRKTGVPAYNLQATYGPLVPLKRIGKDGKLIKVYKLRTMFPYAEYLQAYINEKQGLQEGGKFKDDPRVTTIGRYFRKFWLDETPMIINVLRGEMKLVGVRPLSSHYLSLYPKEMQERRIRYKPGLLPPFYVDLPKTIDEIVLSEKNYFDAYDKNPIKTDLSYFFRIFKNILFKKARSK